MIIKLTRQVFSSPWACAGIELVKFGASLLLYLLHLSYCSINHFGPVILELFCFCTTLWLWCFLNSLMRIRGGPHSSLPRHPSVVSQRPENHFDWADCVVGGGPWGGLEISKDKGSQACLFPVEIVQRLSRQINMVAAVCSGPKWEEQETCCSENGEGGWTRFCRDRDQKRGGK